VIGIFKITAPFIASNVPGDEVLPVIDADAIRIGL
jgi:hypothetical protein